MSNRFYEFDKGSSRSTRDDSRKHNERDRECKRQEDRLKSSKSRSRSPRRLHSPPSSSRSRYSKNSSSTSRDRDYEDDKRSKSAVGHTSNDSDEDVPAPPPPPRITKISIGFSKPQAPIKMNLGGPAKSAPALKPTISSVFNDDDDDDEPEEMPAEAKMRMRNIGRETPTSAGPNSFGKTKQGFCDSKKVFEKNLKEALETADNKPSMTKFPQTIYRIKGP